MRPQRLQRSHEGYLFIVLALAVGVALTATGVVLLFWLAPPGGTGSGSSTRVGVLCGDPGAASKPVCPVTFSMLVTFVLGDGSGIEAKAPVTNVSKVTFQLAGLNAGGFTVNLSGGNIKAVLQAPSQDEFALLSVPFAASVPPGTTATLAQGEVAAKGLSLAVGRIVTLVFQTTFSSITTTRTTISGPSILMEISGPAAFKILAFTPTMKEASPSTARPGTLYSERRGSTPSPPVLLTIAQLGAMATVVSVALGAQEVIP